MLNAIQKAAIRHLTAYHFSPPESRMKHTEWCEVMDITTRTLERWQKDSEFKAALEQAIEDASETADPFALYSRQFSLEQLHVLYKKAKTTTEKRQILKQIMESTEHVADTGDSVNYSDYTDEDLINACLERKVSPLGMTEMELRRLAKGDACSSQDSSQEPSCSPSDSGSATESSSTVERSK